MHPAVMQFCEKVKREQPFYFSRQRVLEIGALNVNGSVRSLFQDCDYTGVDVVPGPGVDVVSKAHDLSYAPESFDVVVSTEALEHDPYWPATLRMANRLLRPGGLLLLTCASGSRGEHGTARTSPEYSGGSSLPDMRDYYRNLSAADLESALDMDHWEQLHCNQLEADLQFAGIKRMWEGAFIGVPTWKYPAGCLRLLRSIAAATWNIDYTVVVINDGTPDDYQEVEQLCSQMGWTYLPDRENRGVYRRWNELLRWRTREYPRHVPVLVNDDVVVKQGWLKSLMEGMSEGYTYPGLRRGWVGFDDKPPGHTRPWAASCMAINPEMLEEIGLFDEHYFLRGGDFDMEFRMWYGGWPVKWIPSLMIHEIARSWGHQNSEQRARSRRDDLLLNHKFATRWFEAFRRFELPQIEWFCFRDF